MLDEKALDDLATRLAALSPEDAAQVHRTVTGLHAERARIEEERIAGLRARDDWDLMVEICQTAQPDPGESLKMLRDAGFIRYVPLEAAYRAGYERGAYDTGNGPQVDPDEEDDEYVRCRGFDLDALVKKGA